jgi:hypothetical protein
MASSATKAAAAASCKQGPKRPYSLVGGLLSESLRRAMGRDAPPPGPSCKRQRIDNAPDGCFISIPESDKSDEDNSNSNSNDSDGHCGAWRTPISGANDDDDGDIGGAGDCGESESDEGGWPDAEARQDNMRGRSLSQASLPDLRAAKCQRTSHSGPQCPGRYAAMQDVCGELAGPPTQAEEQAIADAFFATLAK